MAVLVYLNFYNKFFLAEFLMLKTDQIPAPFILHTTLILCAQPS